MAHLAFYGGSFDPVHRGHLNTIRALLKASGSLQHTDSFSDHSVLKPLTIDGVSLGNLDDFRALDQVFFMPNAAPPHKKTVKTDFSLRVTMLQDALLSNEYANLKDKVAVSTIENESHHNNYTIDTLSNLQSLYPHDKLTFIMGMDSLLGLKSWKCGFELINKANILIFPRPGFALSDLDEQTKSSLIESAHHMPHGHGYFVVEGTNFDFSSTEIRKNVQTLCDFLNFLQENDQTLTFQLESKELSLISTIKDSGVLQKYANNQDLRESGIKDVSKQSELTPALSFLEQALCPCTLNLIIKHNLYKKL